MSQTIILRQEAERDVSEAFAWYEKHLPGLGSRFLDAIELSIISIQNNPAQYPVIYRDVRRVLIHRFPYGIFFITSENAITVIAVMHTAREPSKWRSRNNP